MLRIFVVDRWHFKNAFQCVALPSHNVLAFIVAAGCCCYCCRWCDCVGVGIFRVCVFVDVSDCVWCVHESDRTKGLFHVLGILCACTERTLRFTVFGWFAFFPLILFRFSFFAFDFTLSHTLIHLRSRSSSVPFTLSLSRSLYAAIWCVFWFLDCLTLWLRVRVCKYVCISPICCVFVLFGVWWFEFFFFFFCGFCAPLKQTECLLQYAYYSDTRNAIPIAIDVNVCCRDKRCTLNELVDDVSPNQI